MNEAIWYDGKTEAALRESAPEREAHALLRTNCRYFLTLAAGLLVATLSIASGHLLPYPITTSHNANSIAMYEQADLLTQLI